jgi:hypothetical protein
MTFTLYELRLKHIFSQLMFDEIPKLKLQSITFYQTKKIIET